MELREFLFLPLGKQRFPFTIRAQEEGLFAGSASLLRLSAELGLDVDRAIPDGEFLRAGTPVFHGSGQPQQVARAEETLLGVIGKPSGVATAASVFRRQGGGRIEVVCGAWKKVAPEIRMELRTAIGTGGVGVRMTGEPFIYLDKNHVRMMGGVGPAIRRAREFDPARLIVVQLRGERQRVGLEAGAAFRAGARILMVDTGDLADLEEAAGEALLGGWRREVRLAFAGGVTPDRLPAVIAAGADIVDVGRAIIDAPLLDFRLDVEGE